MWNLKYDTNELIYKTERDTQMRKLRLGRVEEFVQNYSESR